MATAEQYAKWCMRLIEGDDHIVDDIYSAMYDDGFMDDDQEWTVDDEDDEDSWVKVWSVIKVLHITVVAEVNMLQFDTIETLIKES